MTLALLRYAGGKADCWPSNDALARDIDYCDRQVKRLLARLVADGVISVEVDRSLKTQRRITFLSHPHVASKSESREDIFVGAGGTSGCPPKLNSETQEGDGDDVDGEEEWDPRGPRGPAGAADVLRVASLCCYLPDNALRLLEGCRDLGARVEGDWESLALAVVKTELGRARGVVDAVRHPLAYLTKAAASIRSGKVRVDDEVRQTLDAMLGTQGEAYRPPLNPGPVGTLETPGMRREDALIPARVRAWAQQRWEALKWDGAPGIKLVEEPYDDPCIETSDVETVIRLEAMRDEARLALDAPAVERRRAWIEAALREMREQYG